MRVTQGLADGIFPMRHRDQMHVIGHETIPDERTVIEDRVLADEIEIDQAVRVRIENVAAGIATLGDVMRDVLTITRARRST